jgi:lipoprotein
MNRLLYLFISLLSVGCLCTACDDTSDEPQAYPGQLYFSKEGGEAVVTVRSRSGNQKHLSWYPEGTSLNDPRVDCRGGVTDTTMRKEKLVDGGQRVYNDWYSFTISKDQNTIRVKVSANHTGKTRNVALNGGGSKLSFSLNVVQSPFNSK